ncbi:MAG: bis(5'-nucleosyl)-tetraphosphatase (symmetrical) YqeK [Leptospirales bacterium]
MQDLILEIQTKIDLDRNLLYYDQSVKTILSESRHNHCLYCAAIANIIAKNNRIEKEKIEKCVTAAILHDITKEFKEQTHRDLMQQQNQSEKLDEFPKSLWHAITGKVYVRKNLNVNDPEILEAIRFHTTGNPGMGIVAKIVFAADYFSSKHMINSDLDIDKSLDTLCLEKTTSSLIYLVEENKPVHHDTIDFYHHLIESMYGK